METQDRLLSQLFSLSAKRRVPEFNTRHKLIREANTCQNEIKDIERTQNDRIKFGIEQYFFTDRLSSAKHSVIWSSRSTECGAF